MQNIDYSVYLVTDRHCLRGRDFYAAVEEALQAGVTLVQLREKTMTPEELLLEGQKMLALCRRYGVPLLIDDQIEVAKALGCAGVHLGQEDDVITKAQRLLGPEAVIGISAHNLEEAIAAEKAGATYLGVGAMYPQAARKMPNCYHRGCCTKSQKPCTSPWWALAGSMKPNIRKSLHRERPDVP